MMSIPIKKLTNSLLSLFLQSNCPLCDRPAEAEVCQYCHRQLQRCQIENPTELWGGNLPVLVWGNYGGTLKRAIATLKYNNHPQLARPLGFWLGEVWLKSAMAQGRQKLTVVPIPLHRSKQQKRGFNQAALIAQSFCQFTGYSYKPYGLERVRETQAQFSLSRQERVDNLSEAFVLGKSFRRHAPVSPVLLVDDIYTTGATVKSATQTLQGQGIEVYGVVAIARPLRT